MNLRRLKNMKISAIALVDRGANNRDFAIFKSLNKGEKEKMKVIKETTKKLFDDKGNIQVEKVKPETIDAIIELLADTPAPEDIDQAVKLLIGLKEKYGYPYPKPGYGYPEAGKGYPYPEPTRKTALKQIGDEILAKNVKLTKEAKELVQGSINGLSDLLDSAEKVATDEEIKKFVDENTEATADEIFAAIEKKV